MTVCTVFVKLSQLQNPINLIVKDYKMLKQILLAAAAAVSLSACVGSQPYVSRLSPEELRYNAESVDRAERAERAERRRENREEMMDAADAINRANRGRKVYIIR